MMTEPILKWLNTQTSNDLMTSCMTLEATRDWKRSNVAFNTAKTKMALTINGVEYKLGQDEFRTFGLEDKDDFKLEAQGKGLAVVEVRRKVEMGQVKGQGRVEIKAEAQVLEEQKALRIESCQK